MPLSALAQGAGPSMAQLENLQAAAPAGVPLTGAQQAAVCAFVPVALLAQICAALQAAGDPGGLVEQLSPLFPA